MLLGCCWVLGNIVIELLLGCCWVVVVTLLGCCCLLVVLSVCMLASRLACLPAYLSVCRVVCVRGYTVLGPLHLDSNFRSRDLSENTRSLCFAPHTSTDGSPGGKRPLGLPKSQLCFYFCFLPASPGGSPECRGVPGVEEWG